MIHVYIWNLFLTDWYDILRSKLFNLKSATFKQLILYCVTRINENNGVIKNNENHAV